MKMLIGCLEWKVVNMFNYTVAKEADNKAFLNACAKIEKEVKPLKKEKMLVDVDGSLIQIYYTDNKKIKVLNDYDVDAVYIETEKELIGFN